MIWCFSELWHSVTASSSVVGATHICFCAQAHPHRVLAQFSSHWGQSGWIFPTREGNLAQIRCVFHNWKDKQQHLSLQLLSQPRTVNSCGRDIFSWLLNLSLSCSYSVGPGMQIPVVLLFLGLLTVPSRTQNSATEQVSRRQYAESEGQRCGAGNLILEIITEGLSTTLLNCWDFI